jgi:AcrR family transcriptional regulator
VGEEAVAVAGSADAPDRRRDPAADWPPGLAPPTADPAEDLSPTARRLLAAARRVLARDGFSGLTLEAITAEAGENKAAIRYHFGSKDALITTLVEWLDHDDSVRLVAQLQGEPEPRARLDLLVELQLAGCKSHEENQLFFDLLPNVLRDPRLRERLAELYEWYRELDGWVLAPDTGARRDDVRRLAALAIAVGDGLTIQRSADRSFDVDAVFALWERLFRIALDELSQDDTRSEPRP